MSKKNFFSTDCSSIVMTIVKYDVVDSFQVRLKMFAKLHPSKREAESIDIKGDIAIFHTILI